MANEFKIKNGLIVSGSAEIEQDLIVRGTLTVDELHTSITSSSILYESGSTVFGNTLDDTHQLTGSVAITGSITLNGQAIGTGKLDETTFNSYTSSISSSMGGLSSSIATTTSGLTSTITSLSSSLTSSIGSLSSSVATTTFGLSSSIGSLSSSIDSLSSSVATTTNNLSSSISSSIGSLSSSVASINNTQNGRLDSLETASGSIRTNFNTFTSSYTTVSGSIDNRLDVLEAYSGSQLVPSSSMSFRTLQTDVYCKNMSGAQINKGTVVRIVGSVGDNPLIGVASLLTEGQSANTLGIATENIPNDGFGLVITEGVLLGVNTSGMTAGQLLFLGVDGTFTTTPPTAPNHGVRLGEVLRVQQNNGSIYVRIDNGSELGEAHDFVDTTTNSSYGDLLVKSGSVWVNSRSLNGNYSVTGSLIATSFTGSINYNNLTNVPTLVSGSSQIDITGTTGYSTFSSSISTSIGGLSSSVAITTLGTRNRVDSIETTTGSLNTFTSSASGRLTSLETASGSIRTDFNTYTGSNDSTNTTQNSRLTSIEGITGSISLLNTYTGSNNTVIGTLQTSTSSLNSYTSSNTTNIDAIHISTGSFKSFTSSFDTAFGMSGADVTVKGNLTVSGTQTTVNSTTVAIGDNIIQLNGTGATNAGLVVRDATAPNTVSGSFLWDSTSDKWIAGALGSEDDVVLKTATQTLTNKTINASQLVDASVTNTKLANSSITIAGTSTSLGGTISAATILSGTGTVSGSAQITFSGVSGLPTLVSGSSQVSFNGITDKPTLVSGSSQISYIGLSNIPSGIVSSSAQTIANLPSGTVSGSSQVLNGTTIHSGSFFNGISVVSGSAQISFNGITDKPTLVSGSSQITYGSISSIPSGIVSGSAQISFGGITGVPSGLVSGSSQVTGIGNAQLTNSSFFVGTTSISLGRASASQTLTGVSIDGNAATVASLTPFQFFNNMGQNHSTQTDFNSISNFGFRFVQGSTNGPGTGSSQFYGFSIGLGNDYAYSDYALQLAIPRYGATDKYITFRTREATTWGSWNKISAGYADSAGSVSGANVSGNISGNASNITTYTINQSVGTGNLPTFAGVKGSSYFDAQASSGFRIRNSNDTANAGGYTRRGLWEGNSNYDPGLWAETGYGLYFYSNGSANIRAFFDTSGHFVPGANGTYNLGSSSARWNTVFTSDLSLSNGIGDYTIVEGENDLFLYNNKQNKVYKFMLQEVNAQDATPKRPE